MIIMIMIMMKVKSLAALFIHERTETTTTNAYMCAYGDRVPCVAYRTPMTANESLQYPPS